MHTATVLGDLLAISSETLEDDGLTVRIVAVGATGDVATLRSLPQPAFAPGVTLLKAGMRELRTAVILVEQSVNLALSIADSLPFVARFLTHRSEAVRIAAVKRGAREPFRSAAVSLDQDRRKALALRLILEAVDEIFGRELIRLPALIAQKIPNSVVVLAVRQPA